MNKTDNENNYLYVIEMKDTYFVFKDREKCIDYGSKILENNQSLRILVLMQDKMNLLKLEKSKEYK